MSDGNEVIKRLRYLEAISRAFSTRWVLQSKRARSSEDKTSGKACAEACAFRSFMQPRMTYTYTKLGKMIAHKQDN